MKLPPAWIARPFLRAAMWVSSVRRRFLPPQFALMELSTALWPALALRALVVTGVIDRLGRSAASSQELARDLNLHASSTYRVLRLLAGYDVVREQKGGRFALTRIGRRAVSNSDGNAAAFIRYMGEPWQLNPWARLDTSLRTGKPAFEALYGATFFQYAQKSPEVAHIFDAAMVSVSELHARAVSESYDFRGLSTIVDVGGGKGRLLRAILEKNPSARGVLYDAPTVTETPDATLHRVHIESGDFFVRVPEGGDAYLLSHILHDWDDADALRILTNVRAALTRSSRVLVIECILGGADNRWDQGKLTDVQMLATLSGRERTQAEFEQLLSQAGLRLSRIIPMATAESIMEAVPI